MTTDRPQAVDPAAMYQPTFNEIMVIRGSHRNPTTQQDETTEWALRVNGFNFPQTGGDGAVVITGRIVGARFAHHLDERLANQRASIDRLQERLNDAEATIRSLTKKEI